jgi:quercetin dioxygenase-like cupin family protein
MPLTLNRRPLAAAGLVCALLLGMPAVADPPGVHKTTLQEIAFPPPLHTLTVRTVVDRGGVVPSHTHPGIEMSYVLSGAARLTVAGQGTHDIAAGGSFSIPAATVHSLRNVGRTPLVLISTYVVDPTKPITSSAPPPAAGGK